MMNAALFYELTTMVKDELDGCVLIADDGTTLFTPDGLCQYHALWTRDLAYMLEYAGEFITVSQAQRCIEYLLNKTRTGDGWIPDRVEGNGRPVYAAGDFDSPVGKANLDTAAFAVIAMDCCLEKMAKDAAKSFFLKWEKKLMTALEILPRDENGLVFNPPAAPHSPYGFTDCICKTGSLMIESLLLWRALLIMQKWYRKYNIPTVSLQKESEKIELNLVNTFITDTGMLRAATADCNQIDVWGTCYAVFIGFPLTEGHKDLIAAWLTKHYDGLVKAGQIRHTAPDEYWQKCLLNIPLGEYQNGAYWATATGWFADAIRSYAPDLANKTLLDVCKYFKEHGTFECINDAYQKLNHYVVSVTNVYGSAKKLWG